jgi:hypothetical protein
MLVEIKGLSPESPATMSMNNEEEGFSFKI